MYDLHINFHNLAKQFINGRIDQVYSKMYKVAEDLAVHETKVFMESARIEQSSVPNGYIPLEIFKKMVEYRKERTNYHMNEMMKLLEMNLKHQKKTE